MNNKKNLPLISCIMPAYNAGSFLRVAIDSILAQTFENFELIIINDGSTDDTEQIILSYKDPRIVYLKNELNLKLIKTLNRGIDVAKGEYIARMDSDDQARPNLFEKELLAFKQNPHVGIVNTLTWHMNETGTKLRRNLKNVRLSVDAVPVILPIQNVISHPGVMVKSELMKNFRYRDSDDVLHIEDKDLWLRMFVAGIKCYTLKERLLNYRESSGSINAKYAEERFYRNYKISQDYIKEHFGYGNVILFDKLDWKRFVVIQKAYNAYFAYLRKKKIISLVTYLELKKWQLVDALSLVKRLCKF